jgi:hypothetical protein
VLAIERRAVRFSNPGVRDFLDRVVEDDRFAQFAVKVLSEYHELDQCLDILNKSQMLQQQGAPIQRDWIDAIGRLVAGNSGTALRRFELAFNSYIHLPVSTLLTHVMTATAALDEETTDEREIHACEVMLEKVATAGLPSPEVDEVRDVLTAFALRVLEEAAIAMSLEEVESVADALLKFGSTNSAIQPTIHGALQKQIKDIDTMMDGIDTVDDLDSFEEDLRKTLAKYGYQNKGYESDIEYRRNRILEGDFQPRSTNYGSFQSQAPTEATNEQIESMFSGLLK